MRNHIISAKSYKKKKRLDLKNNKVRWLFLTTFDSLKKKIILPSPHTSGEGINFYQTILYFVTIRLILLESNSKFNTVGCSIKMIIEFSILTFFNKNEDHFYLATKLGGSAG